jgi:alpha-D-ribose 1-methylphosphonate 5-triphosphate synthase subunit PhnH
MTALTPGFADPVLDSQACFRAVLDALARPGTIHAVAAPAEPPAPLDRATAAVLLTLADGDTPVWLDDAARAAAPWLAFHCGATLAGQGEAAFAVALSPVPLASLAAGSDEAPQDGATLVLQVRALGEGAAVRLSGPGLARPAVLRADGLPPGFAAEWAANRARFPRGVDVVLCAGDRLAALPRTVTVEDV